uniref:Transglycosylase n=1 Tax=Dulem virus 36 TaxID=3145754 RepID=A0AAU8AZ39_9CAUD
MIIISCDKCGNIMEPKIQEQSKRISGQKITQLFLKCKECGKRYIISYETHSTLFLKKKIRSKTEQLKVIRNPIQYKTELNNIDRYKRMLSKEIEEASKMFEKGKNNG